MKRAEALEALRLVARAAGADIAVPRGLRGRISIAATDVPWEDLVVQIASASESRGQGRGHLRVERNGLVRVEP